ncbi:MAG: hypothetical protein AMJ46_11920 [Latescibacteria bacterium DG_63]|nr:MAG: hypothetical protein AMJ46_11920 [Latescibacteria bacterium DG_63]
MPGQFPRVTFPTLGVRQRGWHASCDFFGNEELEQSLFVFCTAAGFKMTHKRKMVYKRCMLKKKPA